MRKTFRVAVLSIAGLSQFMLVMGGVKFWYSVLFPTSTFESIGALALLLALLSLLWPVYVVIAFRGTGTVPLIRNKAEPLSSPRGQ